MKIHPLAENIWSKGFSRTHIDQEVRKYLEEKATKIANVYLGINTFENRIKQVAGILDLNQEPECPDPVYVTNHTGWVRKYKPSEINPEPEFWCEHMRMKKEDRWEQVYSVDNVGERYRYIYPEDKHCSICGKARP